MGGTGDSSKFARSKVAVRLSALLATNLSHTFLHPFSSPTPQPPNPPTTTKPATMPPKSTVPPRQIKTRTKNKDTHPGIPDQAPPRRTSVEVENERAAK